MRMNNLMEAKKSFTTIEINEIAKSSHDESAINYCTSLHASAELDSMDVQELVDVIVTRYHNNLNDQASLIYDLGNNLFRSDGYLYPNLSKLVEHFFIFFQDLLCQFSKEEQILFPNIIHLAEKKLHEGVLNYAALGIVREYADKMKRQHQAVLEGLSVFRDLTGNYKIIEGDCRSYMDLMEKMKEFEKELIEHINVEVEILIPRAIRLSER
jgi:regulator of cell morphogenesis and NO signaling